MADSVVQLTRSKLGICLFLALFGTSAWAGGKHSHHHGNGQMELVLDGKALSISLYSPLHNVLGFEHTPRTDAERVKARRVTSLLKANGLFAFSPNARCKRTDHALHSSVLNPGPKGVVGEHSDLHATYAFECEFPEKLKVIDVRVFRQFPGFEKIEVQALFPSGQVGASLTPAKNILEVQ